MIPSFPTFKKVTVTDREAVEAYTREHLPYSDFNFTSLWAWDTSEGRMISELNGNLVVRFTDYTTNEPFLSFLGAHKVEDTTRILLEYARAQKLPPVLKLMPEVSIHLVAQFQVQEDRDNFDYIYSVDELRTLKGKKFETKRNMLSRFMRAHPEAVVKHIDLKDTLSHALMHDVLRLWAERKSGISASEHELEFESIRKLLKHSPELNLLATGIMIGEKCVAFSIDEVLRGGYAISHFAKADSGRAGAYDFLMRAVVNRLADAQVQFLNFEQDLGVANLRSAKNSFRPVSFLKKYTVSPA
jgi:hypothetical protein